MTNIDKEMSHKKAETLNEFITRIESTQFRTDHDTGANEVGLFIWNLVRVHAGLPRMEMEDLPRFCQCCKAFHKGGATIDKDGNKRNSFPYYS